MLPKMRIGNFLDTSLINFAAGIDLDSAIVEKFLEMIKKDR